MPAADSALALDMRALAIAVLAMAATADATPKRKPAALVILIDRSSSMQGPRLDVARAAALAAIDGLGPDDQISVIAFDSRATLVARLLSPRNRKWIAFDLSTLSARGGTALVPALQLAFDTLRPLKVTRKHVLVVSDGEAPIDGVHELVADMRAAHILVSTFAVPEADRGFLSMIADSGDGHAYSPDELDRLPEFIAAEIADPLR